MRSVPGRRWNLPSDRLAAAWTGPLFGLVAGTVIMAVSGLRRVRP
jgi:hypothetical protein